MPFDPKAVGRNLISIGDKEIATGQKLDSAARKLGQVAELLKAKGRVDKSMVSIEAGTRSTRNLLAPVGVALHFVANKLDDITVPEEPGKLGKITRLMAEVDLNSAITVQSAR